MQPLAVINFNINVIPVVATGHLHLICILLLCTLISIQSSLPQAVVSFRWNIVIRGGIDDYSRLIVYLAAANNLAFQTTCEKYGVPARVRMDQGTENNQVANFMLEKYPTKIGAVLKGKSVHNQCIERLWLEAFKNVLSFYHDLFSSFEVEGYVDVNNQKHILALHYTFLPLLQRKLSAFTKQHNHHSLSTEGQQSPQL